MFSTQFARHAGRLSLQQWRGMSSRVLVIAEHDEKNLNVSTLSTITAAKSIGETDVLVAGKGSAPVAEQATKVKGVSKVFSVQADHYDQGLPENMAALVEQFHKKNPYTHILAPASVFGKSFLPRVAALLDVNQISDIVSVKDDSTFVRPMYAGSVLATVKSKDAVKVVTVRPSAFDKAEAEGGSAVIEQADAAPDAKLSTFAGANIASSARPDLASAPRVVAGGRGVKSKENFKLIEDLADAVGAGVGASRAAVDAGYCPNDWQIGQTGKIIAPDLYIGVGISGAIQHLAGMKDSKVIVAINKDKEAPIFSVADYGLVADLFEAVPALVKEINAKK